MLDSFQDGVVLEIGCGSGKALLELKAKYPRMQVYGTNLRGYGYSQTNGSIESFWSIALYFGIPVLCDVHGSPGFPIVQETEKIQSPKFADVLPRIGFDFIFSRHSLNEGQLQSFESPLAITQLLPLLKRCDPHLWHYLGADYGRVSDLNVLWPLAIGRTLKRLTPFVVEMRRIPFDSQRQVQDYILSRLPRYGASKHDATGLGFSMAEAAQQKFGALRAEAVMLNIPWYRENAEPLKSAFEDDMIEIPADSEIAADLRLVQVKAGVPFVPNLRVGEKKDRHGDSAVALMLAYAASRSTPAAYDYESAGRAAEDRRDEDALEDERRGLGARGLW